MMTNGETQRKDTGNTYTNEWCDDKTKTMTNTKNKNTIRIMPIIRQILIRILRIIRTCNFKRYINNIVNMVCYTNTNITSGNTCHDNVKSMRINNTD